MPGRALRRPPSPTIGLPLFHRLFRDVPHHQLLMTDVEIVDGIVTGVLHHGNCVRQGKADRVAAYMREQGPFGDTYGYGNFPDDVPMLNLMKYRVIV